MHPEVRSWKASPLVKKVRAAKLNLYYRITDPMKGESRKNKLKEDNTGD